MIAELLWVIDRAEEHLGPERAARYLRKFYPWYLERLGADKEIADAFQQSEDLDEARRLVSGLALLRRRSPRTVDALPSRMTPGYAGRLNGRARGRGRTPMIKNRCSRLVLTRDAVSCAGVRTRRAAVVGRGEDEAGETSFNA